MSQLSPDAYCTIGAKLRGVNASRVAPTTTTSELVTIGTNNTELGPSPTSLSSPRRRL